MNSFEGGLITTNNDEIAKEIKLKRNFGFVGEDKVVSVGVNGKMSEVSAAMGLTSFESVDYFIDVNKRNYLKYRDCLQGIDGIDLFPIKLDEERNYQYVVVIVDEEKTGLSRDQLREILRKENILSRRYFYPGIHNMEPYKSYYPSAGLLLPETQKHCQDVLVLPTGTTLEEEDIETICSIIRVSVENPSDFFTVFANN